MKKFKKIDEMTPSELNSLTKVSVGFLSTPIKDRKKVIGSRYQAVIQFSPYLKKRFNIKESTYNLLALYMKVVSGNAFRIDNCPVYFTKGLDAKGETYYLYEAKLSDRNYIRDFFNLDEIEVINLSKLPIVFIDRPDKEVANMVVSNEIKES